MGINYATDFDLISAGSTPLAGSGASLRGRASRHRPAPETIDAGPVEEFPRS